jgi:two-component system, sensor histidine kinase YesM
MKKVLRTLAGWKLNRKFTLIIFLIVFIPVMALTTILFSTTRQTLIREKIGNTRLDMEQMHARIQKTVDVCQITTQAFSSNASLLSYLRRVKSGDMIAVMDSLTFFRNDIATLGKLMYANPYLYQIRVFADSNTMPEMMPILYRTDRMKRLSWAQEPYLSGGWHFNYSDKLFPDYITTQTKHLMSLVTTILDPIAGEVGIVETAVLMDNMLPDLFSASPLNFLCFVSSNGGRYYDDSLGNPWAAHVSEMLSLAQGGQSATFTQLKLNGQEVVLAALSIPELSGRLVQLVSLEPEFSAIRRQIVIFYVCMAVFLALLAVAINQVVRAVLRRFYAVSDLIGEVQKGNLDVIMPHSGNDEVSHMAVQINIMLDKIKQLMADNTKRELLAKNAEIRALQNQINAHFIYNVLESIKMTAEVEERYEIANAVTALGKLLRYSMKWSSQSVTVRDEIEYIRNYVALINLRFEYSIFLSLRLPDAILCQKIPKMSLQPIVENAICHGLEQIAQDAYIYMKGTIEGGDCLIEITDPGRGMSQVQLEMLHKKLSGELEADGGAGNGIGLKNVQDRLRITFGENYGLTILSKQDYYTKVIVRIPLCEIVEARL